MQARYLTHGRCSKVGWRVNQGIWPEEPRFSQSPSDVPAWPPSVTHRNPKAPPVSPTSMACEPREGWGFPCSPLSIYCDCQRSAHAEKASTRGHSPTHPLTRGPLFSCRYLYCFLENVPSFIPTLYFEGDLTSSKKLVPLHPRVNMGGHPKRSWALV